MKIDVLDIFWVVLLIVGEGELITIEDLSQSVHGYQLLPLATSYLVGNNREFDVSDIFWGVLLIVGEGEIITTQYPLLSVHGYQLLPLATSYLVGNNMKIWCFWHIWKCFIHCWYRGA